MDIGSFAWLAGLFVLTLLIGVFAPVAGVGGGVLFVPLAAAFFPFSMDFIRGAGLITALASALASAPHLTRQGLANLRVMVPVAVVSTATSIVGGVAGLWITNTFPQGQHYMIVAIGVVLLGAFALMLTSKGVELPEASKGDRISSALGMSGAWYEPSLARVVTYQVRNVHMALPAFALIGLGAGMFGLGAGWASVPALNLIMGAPIKVASSTSMLIISVNGAGAAWVYLAKGAVLPVIVVPAVLGMTIGARIGARIAARARPRFVRYLVLGVMLIAAVMDVAKGLSGLGVIPSLFW